MPLYYCKIVCALQSEVCCKAVFVHYRVRCVVERGGGGELYYCKAVFVHYRVRCVVGGWGGGGGVNCTTVKLCLCITE